MYIARDLQKCTFPRLRKILNMGGSINCERSEQHERLREVFTEVQVADPRRRLQGGSAPCLGKFCIRQAKYA